MINPGKFKLWSISFFGLPLILAIYFGIWVYVLILIIVMLASLMYHATNEKHFAIFDSTFAWILIGGNIVLCYTGSFKMPYFAFTLGFVIISLYLYWFGEKKLNYDLDHGFWHLFSSLITIFSMLTFVG